jgi:hypothetical protein
MTPRKLRLLAECLDLNFITAEDRKGWATDLRGFAKDIERSMIIEVTDYPTDKAPEEALWVLIV